MKLIIQIPCFNEEETLATTLAALPRKIAGIDTVEWLVIDDGSTDRTVDIAVEHRVDHIVRLARNMGLAQAFRTGLEACLDNGADIIVNTDGDNQYCADDIPKLIEPILQHRADMTIGARPIDQIESFSASKKWLQKLGSAVVRTVSGTQVADSPSGFRAISRAAAFQLNVFNEYTYTLETVIQAGHKNLAVESVPIRTNPGAQRPSRLVKSIPSYVARSMLTIFRIFMVYRPLRFFSALAVLPFLVGSGLFARWLVLFLFVDPTRSRAPSLILAAVLLVVSTILFALGLLGEQLSVNRKLLEDMQLRMRLAQSGERGTRDRES